MDIGAQGLELSSAAFPSHQLGAGIEAEKPGDELVLIWDASATDGGLA